MKQYRRYRKSAATPFATKALLMRKRIARNRRRAKFVGALYLLATIALAAIACLPLFEHDLAPVTVMEFYKSFLPENLKGFSLEDTDTLIIVINSALYAVLLFALLINVFKSLGKLGWLCKKKGNKTHGFNRNVYAMEDMGRIFSGSFAAILSVYVLIAVLCGELAVTTLMLIAVGAGVVIRLFLGFWGAKIAYYDYDNGEIVEDRRKVGRISPFVRNLLQFAAIGGILYYFNYQGVNETLRSLTSQDGLSALLEDMNGLITFAAQVLIVLCMFVLIKHATNITEYNFEGAKGAGMKNFRIFSFLIFLFAGAAMAYRYFLVAEEDGGKVLNENLLYVAAIALGIFLIEVIMRKRPKLPGEKQKKNKKKKDEEEEFSFDAFTRYQQAQAKLAAQQAAQPQPQLQISMFK